MNIFSRTKARKISSQTILEHEEFGLITFVPKPRTRSIKISVIPFQGVQVIMPMKFSMREAKKFIDLKKSWIQKRLLRARETEERSKVFFETLKPVSPGEIRTTLNTRLQFLSEAHGFRYNKLSIRDQKSRWGSCSSKNNISLNRKLYFLPSELSDYVLMHELAHTVQKNHSTAFWKILYDILGETKTKKSRSTLRDFEFLFYPPPTESV